ncbi:sensor domain-containing diguanylate cyclase [Modicisalibacter luteus]|uniref:sensor domain-containing diguanylate cyclase n=1 Tax=Modicisalibacter luteus TaxID=453962 RepID=UPI003638ECBE
MAKPPATAWRLTILLLLWLTSVAVANDDVPGSIDIGALQHQLLRAPTSYLVTDTRTSLQEVLNRDFQPLTNGSVNQGISSRTYWLRVRLQNTETQDRRWVMHHETAYLDNMTAYVMDSGQSPQEIAMTDRVPFHERSLHYRKLGFEHTTPAGDWSDVYLRLDYAKADSISLNVHLWDHQAYVQKLQEEHLLFGGYFGITVALCLIALLFAFVMREATYLYYALFLTISGLMWAQINGFAYQYLFPAQPYWHNEGCHIGYLLFVIITFQFTRTFLHTAEYFPRINRLMYGLQLIMILAIGLRLLGDYGVVLHIAYASLTLPLLMLPALGWLAYRKGMVYARWFSIAWLVYSLGLATSLISAYTRLLPWGMEALTYAQIGSLLESMFLLVALGERLRSREEGRHEALRQANYDPLTQLGNRRLLAQQYDVVARRFENTGMPVFLLMIDLDHFKALNDTYGHLAGDHILQKLADLLRAHCQGSGTCVRLGGEEFAMLLQVPDQRTALEIAERIRQAFCRTPTHYREQHIVHTLSIGLAPVLTAERKLSLQEAMIQADEALYQGKVSSRNCTTVYESAA